MNTLNHHLLRLSSIHHQIEPRDAQRSHQRHIFPPMFTQRQQAQWWMRHGCEYQQAYLHLKVDWEDLLLERGELRHREGAETEFGHDEALREERFSRTTWTRCVRDTPGRLECLGEYRTRVDDTVQEKAGCEVDSTC